MIEIFWLIWNPGLQAHFIELILCTKDKTWKHFQRFLAYQNINNSNNNAKTFKTPKKKLAKNIIRDTIWMEIVAILWLLPLKAKVHSNEVPGITPCVRCECVYVSASRAHRHLCGKRVNLNDSNLNLLKHSNRITLSARQTCLKSFQCTRDALQKIN